MVLKASLVNRKLGEAEARYDDDKVSLNPFRPAKRKEKVREERRQQQQQRSKRMKNERPSPPTEKTVTPTPAINAMKPPQKKHNHRATPPYCG